MSADEWTPGERLAAIVAQEINDAPAAELIKAATDDVLRGWAAKIREVGAAKGWSVWAAAFLDPDSDFVDTGMPSTESIVAELRRLDRLAILRQVDERLAAMKLPEHLKGTFNAASYADAWQDCRARVASMVAEAGAGPRLPDHTVNEEEAPDSDGTPPAQGESAAPETEARR